MTGEQELKTKSPETKPETTVADYATRIRSKFESITKRLPFFPECYQYLTGNEPLFVYDQRNEPNRIENMVVLQPNGQIVKGRVNREVGHSTTKIRLDGASAVPADDIDVILHGPALITRLFKQVESEIPKQTNITDIKKTISIIKQLSIGNTIYKSSQEAKRLILGASSDIDSTSFIETLPYYIDREELSRYDSAIRLLEQRKAYLEEAEKLKQDQAIDPIREFVGGLLNSMDTDGLLSDEIFGIFGTKEFDGVKMYELLERWYISRSGESRHLRGNTWEDDPIGMIKNCRYMVENLIDKAVKGVFPKLDQEPETPPF